MRVPPAAAQSEIKIKEGIAVVGPAIHRGLGKPNHPSTVLTGPIWGCRIQPHRMARAGAGVRLGRKKSVRNTLRPRNGWLSNMAHRSEPIVSRGTVSSAK